MICLCLAAFIWRPISFTAAGIPADPAAHSYPPPHHHHLEFLTIDTGKPLTNFETRGTQGDAEERKESREYEGRSYMGGGWEWGLRVEVTGTDHL